MLGVEGRTLPVTKEVVVSRFGAVSVDVGQLGGLLGHLWCAMALRCQGLGVCRGGTAEAPTHVASADCHARSADGWLCRQHVQWDAENGRWRGCWRQA